MKCLLQLRESRRPLLFGQLIIMVVYLPIFALTVSRARCSTPWLSRWSWHCWGHGAVDDLFVPAAVALFLTGSVGEKENRLMGWAKRAYEPLLDKALSRQPLVLTIGRVGSSGGADGHPHGQRVHPQPGRARHRTARLAHPRHQLEPGHRDANAALNARSSPFRR